MSSIHEQIIQQITNDLGLDSATATEFLNEYIELLPGEILNLKKAVEDKDFAAGASIAHYIKGTSGNLRIVPLYEIMSELEQALKNSQSDLILEMMPKLENFVTGLVQP